MEDFSTLIYIAAGIFYLVIRLLGGKKKKGQAPQQQSGKQGNKRTPKSFEELLQEFSDQAEQAMAPPKEEQPAYTEPVQEVQESQPQSRSYDDQEALSRYQQSVQMAQQSQRNELLTSKIGSAKSGRMGSYKIRKKRNVELEKTRKLLSNPKNLRQAVILKEIIDRKY